MVFKNRRKSRVGQRLNWVRTSWEHSEQNMSSFITVNASPKVDKNSCDRLREWGFYFLSAFFSRSCFRVQCQPKKIWAAFFFQTSCLTLNRLHVLDIEITTYTWESCSILELLVWKSFFNPVLNIFRLCFLNTLWWLLIWSTKELDFANWWVTKIERRTIQAQSLI